METQTAPSRKYLNLENQCPVCLKILNSKRYLTKHLFMNKKKCVAPEGHTPPIIDYEKQTITWPQTPVASTTSQVKLDPVTTTKTKNDKPRKKNLLIAPLQRILG